MSETVNTRTQVTFNGNSSVTPAIGSATASSSVNLIYQTGASFTGSTQYICDIRTVASSGTDIFSVSNYSGTNDLLGQPIALTHIKGVIFQNMAGTDASSMTVGGGPIAGQWKGSGAPFEGNTGVTVMGNSVLALAASGTGWNVASSAGSNVQVINNDSVTAQQYTIVFYGSNF